MLQRIKAGLYRVGNIIIIHGEWGWYVLYGGAFNIYALFADSLLKEYTRKGAYIPPYVKVKSCKRLKDCLDFINWEMAQKSQLLQMA